MLYSSRKKLLSALILLLLACATPTQAADRALLIGINQYQDSDIPKLQGTMNDVQSFHQILVQRLQFKDSEIRELKNETATHDGILNTIDDWLIKGSKPGDRVVLYYSGHGEQTEDKNGDEQDGQDESLVAYDAVLATGQNYVLDDDINRKIQALTGREVLAVIDSCHSGTVTRGISVGINADAKTPTQGGGSRAFSRQHQLESGFIDHAKLANPTLDVTAFFAVSPLQLALESKLDKDHPHGVFTGAFVEGVNGKADKNADNQVSYAELFEYVRQRSDDYCKANAIKCEKGLTPEKDYDPSKAGQDFLQFGKAQPTAPASPPQTAEAILPHGNTARLDLSILPGNHLRLGETVRYQLQSSRPGKLVIFDLDSNGKLTQLFPYPVPPGAPPECRQSLGAADWVPADKTLRLPDNCMGLQFTAQEPLGAGKVVAVLIEDAAVDTQDLIGVKHGYTQVSGQAPAQGLAEHQDGEQWMRELRARLDKVIHEPDGQNRAARWSVTTADYVIAR